MVRRGASIALIYEMAVLNNFWDFHFLCQYRCVTATLKQHKIS